MKPYKQRLAEMDPLGRDTLRNPFLRSLDFALYHTVVRFLHWLGDRFGRR